MIDLPEGPDPDLTPGGSYRVEFKRTSIAKKKLVETSSRSFENNVGNPKTYDYEQPLEAHRVSSKD